MEIPILVEAQSSAGTLKASDEAGRHENQSGAARLMPDARRTMNRSHSRPIL
jgi:hypothetical protein